jgi:hypothetical protein
MERRLFVTVLEGTSPDRARPIFASDDRRIVAAVAREVGSLLTTRRSGLRAVELTPEQERFLTQE